MQIYLIGWKIRLRQASVPWMFFSFPPPNLSHPLVSTCFPSSFISFGGRSYFCGHSSCPLCESHNDHLCPCLSLFPFTTVPLPQPSSLLSQPPSLPHPVVLLPHLIIRITSCGDAPYLPSLKYGQLTLGGPPRYFPPWSVMHAA